jgi:predicted PolB exonuclease-like 3'-5' exonuclease|tara:strand:- start:93791 stop:93982 length:192 start_codon:yes stop_codon:yes gene_type:complete
MFLACFKNIETGEFKRYEISKFKSDIKKLYAFLEQKELTLIGYNSINFDYPVLHNTILKRKRR